MTWLQVGAGCLLAALALRVLPALALAGAHALHDRLHAGDLEPGPLIGFQLGPPDEDEDEDP